MSSEVEQRVVQMQFDNAQFEDGVQETLQSLTKLDKQIENTTTTKTSTSGLAKIFDNLGDSASEAEQNVAKLANAFSPLGVIGRTVIENLTNKCANFAIQAGKVLTGITAAQSGFDKFTQKSKAVSDLMNATGASMDEVADALDNLNWFTDETSYNFTDMVSTMSKLAATGEKDLNKLTRSAEGIALWGAKAGANAQTVSRSMYQLTQAVGRGYIGYQDWLQSAVNTNMATAEIKQQLIEAAGATAIAAGATEDFNSSLKDGWLTFEVFNKVMDQYTEGIDSANYANGEFINSQNGVEGATNAFSEAAFRNAQECKSWGDVVDAVADSVGTSWMQTFEYIFGNYEEAKALWTGLANLAFEISGAFSEYRNNIFSEWKDNGGREAALEAMVNLINALYRVIKPVGEAFTEVFGGINGKNLAGATKSLLSFTKTLKITHSTMMKIKSVFTQIFTVIKNVITVVAPLIKYILLISSINTILKTLGVILSGGLGLGTVLTLIRAIIVLGITGKLTGLNKVLGTVGNVITTLIGVLAGAILKVKEFLSTISKTTAFQDFVKYAKLAVTAVVNLVKTIISNVPKVVTTIKNSKIFDFIKTKVKDLATLLGEFLTWVMEKISDAGTFLSSFFNKVDSASQPLVTVAENTKQLTTALTENKQETDATTKMMEKFSNLTVKSGKKSGAHTKIIKKNSEAVKDLSAALNQSTQSIATNVNTTTAAVSKETSTLSSFVLKIKGVVDYLKNKVDWNNVLAVGAILLYCYMIKKLGDAFKSVGSAIDNFVNPLKKVNDSLISLLSTLKSKIKNDSKFKWFYQIAIGIGVLTASLIALSFVPFDKIKTGAVILGVITASVIGMAVAFTVLSNKVDPVNVVALAAAILSFTAAIVVLGVELGLIAVVVNIVITACTDAQTGTINFVQVLLRLVAPVAIIAGLIVALAAGLKIMMTGMSTLSPGFLKAAAGVLALAGSLAAFGVSLIVISLGIGSLVLLVSIIINKFMEAGAYINELAHNEDKVAVAMSALLVGILAFIAISGLVIGVLALLNKVTKEMALNALMIAAAFGIIAASLALIQDISYNFVTGVEAVGTALIALGIFIAFLNTPYLKGGIEQVNKISKSLLVLAASVAILAGAVVVLSKLDPNDMFSGLAGIVSLLVVLGLFVHSLEQANIKGVAVALLGMVAAIYALIPIMLLLSVAAKQLAVGIVLCLAIMFVLAKSLSMLSKIDLAKCAAGMLGLVAVMGVLTFCFMQLSKLDWKALAASAAALVLSFLAMSYVMSLFMTTITQFTGYDLVKIAVGIGLFCGVILSLAAAMLALQKVDFVTVIAFFAGITVVIIAFTASMFILINALAYFDAALATAIPFLGVFALALGAFALVVLSFGISAALFGVGVSLIINAIIAFLPALQQFITYLLSLANQKDVIDTMSTTLSTFSQTLLDLAISVAALAVAAALFAVCGLLASAAMAAFALAGGLLSAALNNLSVSLQAFLTLLVAFAMQSDALKTMAGALALIGAALVIFAAGAALAGLALPILSVGIAALSLALSLLVAVMERAMNAIIRFKTSLALIDKALAGTANEAKSCGDNIINGFIEGIKSGVDKLFKAVKTVAEGVINKFKDVLGIHSPSVVAETLGKFFDLGLIEGIDGNSSGILSSAKSIGIDLGGLSGLFGDVGSSLGGSFLSGLKSKISSGLSSMGVDTSSFLGGILEEDINVKINKMNAENNEYYNSHKTKSDDDIISLEDLLSSSSIDDITDSLNGETDALGANTEALDSNSGSSSAAADAQDDLADALKNVEDNAKSSLGFFSSFDKSLSSVITAKEMIANFESQSNGITSFYGNLGALAAKGYSQEFIQELMEEGTSAYPKVASLLKATADEAAQIQKSWDNKAAIAANAKLLASTALTAAGTIANLKKEDEARKDSVKTVNECLTKYKKSIEDAQNANLDLNEVLLEVRDSSVETGEAMEDAGPKEELITSYHELQQAILEAGLTNEDLQEAMLNDEGFTVQENGILSLMERIAELQSIISQFNDMGDAIKENAKSMLESTGDIFDEYSQEYKLSADQMLKNAQDHINARQTMYNDMMTITANGGAELLSLVSDFSADELHALANASTEKLSQMTEYYKAYSQQPATYSEMLKAAFFQYGQIGGTGYQEALAEMAASQELLTQTQDIGTNVGQGLVNGMNEALDTVEATGNNLGQKAVDGTAEGAGTHSPSVKTHEIGYNIDQGLMDGVDEQMFTTKAKGTQLGEIVIAGIILGISRYRPILMSCVRMTCEMTRQTFAEGLDKAYFSEIGYNICAGLVEGIESGRSDVINAAVSTASDAYAAACAALEIQSPSRKMKWVGQMFDAGFAKGIDDGSNGVNDAVSSAMIQALGTAVDLIESDDLSPTITPVVDLSDVQNGSRLIGSMFGNGYGLNVKTNIGDVTTPTDRMNAAIQGMSSNTATFGDTNINIYASAGMDENALADKVIKRINVEYARRKAAWT